MNYLCFNYSFVNFINFITNKIDNDIITIYYSLLKIWKPMYKTKIINLFSLKTKFMAIFSDKWEFNRPQWLLGQDLYNSTVGIIGLGSIGAVICKKLKAFDVGTILYTGRSEKQIGMIFLFPFQLLTLFVI